MDMETGVLIAVVVFIIWRVIKSFGSKKGDQYGDYLDDHDTDTDFDSDDSD